MTLFPSSNTADEASSEPRLLTRQTSSATVAEDQARSRSATPPPPKRPRRRIILRTLAALLLLTLIVLVSTAISWRHALKASLPQLDGTLHATGLTAAVTVTRDDHGVPSIQATNLDDLLFAQGFVTAQDRLWQMDALRRHAAGELAEILGPSLVPHDRSQRTLQLRAAADRAAAALPPDQLAQLQAYACGVNAFITANAAHLPVEFHILHYTPAPWTPRDSLLVSLAMFQDLGTEFPTKLSREALSAHLAPELIADLYPVGSWRDHTPGQTTPDLTLPQPEVEQIPLDETQSRLKLPTATPSDLLATQASLLLQTCEGCRSGSNNWAVAGTHSASGSPMVSNDMHLALGIPDVWYEASLHGGPLDVTGLTLPGVPFVIVGRNAHVAWAVTNLGGDVQDVYIEHLRGTGNNTEFELPTGAWQPVAHHAELITVRGGSNITLDVQTTTHNIGTTPIPTPIISPLYPSERRALSLAWTAYDPANVTSPFLAANTAADGAALTAAFANFGGPSLNLVYADDHNHIGYHTLGRIPIRGPAIHHAITAPTATPDAAPPDEQEEPAASNNPTPSSQTPATEPRETYPRARLLTTSWSPQRRPSPQPKAPPRPVEPTQTPADPPTPAFTIGSQIPPIPIDALDPNAQWSGYIPYAELPSVTDPSSGVLATANARITPDGYPYAIALNWASPYRVERITKLLAGRTGLTPADMLHTEMDVHSEFDLALAHHIAYALDRTLQPNSPDAKRLHQAADILRNWNGEVDTTAAAPSIVTAVRVELLPLLLTSQITAHDRAFNIHAATKPEDIAHLYSWGEQAYALEQLVLHSPARWLPKGFASWNDLLTEAVVRGLKSTHAPSDLAMWSYSKAHPVTFDHPLLSMTPLFDALLGVTSGSGPRVVAGDTSTIKATSRAFGPTERFTADLSTPNATTSNITTGQSGNPASPWYLDQLPMWLGGTTLPMPLHNAPATHTLTLLP